MMRRENRFLVIKRADIDKYLTEDEQLKLHTYAAKVDIQRLKQDEKLAKSYVVVAENWPMYEDTWKAIEQYVDTGAYTRTDTQEVEQLRQELDTLKKCKQERDELQKRISQYKLDCLYVTKELEAIKQDHINTALDLADTQRERDSLAAYVERLRIKI